MRRENISKFQNSSATKYNMWLTCICAVQGRKMFLLKSYIIHAYISSFILHQQFYYWLITIYVVHIYSDNISNFNHVQLVYFIFQCLNQHVPINNKNVDAIKFIRYTRKVEKPKFFKALGVSKPKSINRIDKITERIAQYCKQYSLNATECWCFQKVFIKSN